MSKKSRSSRQTTSKRKAPSKAYAAARRKPKREGLSMIEAAHAVLLKAKTPLRCADIVGTMKETGMWSSPKGKTPERTLYTSLSREIKTRGDESRFRKTDRGLFEANR